MFNYTCSDICAMADARGSTYGKIHSMLENGYALPPLRKDTKWPTGSRHKGEDRLGHDAETHPFYIPGQEPPEKPKPKKRAEDQWIARDDANGGRYACGCCLKPLVTEDAITIFEKRDGMLCQTGLYLSKICQSCYEELMPPCPPSNKVTEHNLVDKDGRRLRPICVAICMTCGRTYEKKIGMTITSEFYGDFRRVSGYLCDRCAPRFTKLITKK